jgi:hypothetical protein
MDAILSRSIITGAFFVLIFASGFWLSHTGRPYSGLLFNVHKLIALGGVVFLGVIIARMNHSTPLSAAQWLAVALAAVCLAALIVSGGLLNIEKMPAILLRLHHILPYAAVLLVASTLYFLLSRAG